MKALVAMSGGVDSSVAAALMLEAGHEAIGVTLKQWEGPDGQLPTAGCCTVADAEDARRVAATLGIPYYVLDHTSDFMTSVVDPFADAYANGYTPNPCIECNRRVRFAALLERTEALGCDVLVTGHHARIAHEGGFYRLLKGLDRGKDQSYVLHMLGQEELAKVLLPIGEMTKDVVRAKAEELGLATASKPDSQDLCFVDGDYRDFIRERRPEVANPGDIVDTSGVVIGSHAGTVDFTIGQRRGLGVALGEPRFVVEVKPEVSQVVIGRREDLLRDGCIVEDVSFVAAPPVGAAEVGVKLRYRSDPVPATIREVGARWEVRFAVPEAAAAPGQAAVFYRGDEVLGGGTIVGDLG